MRTDILKAALFTPIAGGRWGLPFLLWGEPGVAKTAIIEELARAWGLPCETLSPGERGEGAFGVVPVPIKGPNGIVLAYPRPDWTEHVEPAGLVFVDEATTAPPALQPPLMGLLLARRIGGHTFGPRVRVVAAANPPELAAGGFDLAAPVANRVGHLQWDAPTVDEHAAFMMRGETGNGGVKLADPKLALDEEERVLKAWPDPWAKARGLETAFLRARPNLKNICPAAGDPKGSRGWPSDRSWENACRALASADAHGLGDVEKEVFVSSFVGEGVASELFAFAEANDLPDPAMVLDGKDKFVHSGARLDRTAALLNGCASLVTPSNAAKRKDRVEALWNLLADLTGQNADLDILAPCAQALTKAGLHDRAAANKSLAKLFPILKAAGVSDREAL
jgi:MoxR-like ATPase